MTTMSGMQGFQFLAGAPGSQPNLHIVARQIFVVTSRMAKIHDFVVIGPTRAAPMVAALDKPSNRPLDCYVVYTIYRPLEAHMAISGCKDRKTERFLAGERVKEFQAFANAAARALTRLQAAVILSDLRNPPSNRFEALHGDRSGQYSIRINEQYRVCFKWAPHAGVPGGTNALQVSGDAYDVEITDYH